MAEGLDKPADGPENKAPAPHHDGPLGSSGAAPSTASPSKDKPPPPSADKPASTRADKPAEKPTPKAEEGKKAEEVKKPDETKKASDTKKAEEPAKIDLDKPAVVTTGSAGRRVTQVLRRANPVRAARSTRAWAKRPAGRFLVPTFLAVVLIGAAGTAGAILVPKALDSASAPRASSFPFDGAAPSVSSDPAQFPGGQFPGAPSGGAGLPSAGGMPTAPAAGTGQRPAAALKGWAEGVGTRVGIPVVAVEAYGYAELVAARTAPGCRLSWTTIAAIGMVESAHGSANGAVLGADGSVQPPILGLPLDGNGGRQLIRDTDQGTIDGDATFDRAVGPMQFIPATWREMAVDADNNGISDPNDIDDAALAAALYLCRGGRDLSRPDSWWDAILSYNQVQPYAQKVFDAANEYGQRSRV